MATQQTCMAIMTKRTANLLMLIKFTQILLQKLLKKFVEVFDESQNLVNTL